MSGNRPKWRFSKGVGHFESTFQREGGIAHQALLVPENFSDCRFVWYENIRSPSFSFVTIHASDRQTDRRTEFRQQYRALHYMQSHGINRTNQRWWRCRQRVVLPDPQTTMHRCHNLIRSKLTSYRQLPDLLCRSSRQTSDMLATVRLYTYNVYTHIFILSLSQLTLGSIINNYISIFSGLPNRRRISQSQQAMWLLPSRPAGLRPAVTGGRRSAVWENIEQPAPHSVPATSTSISSITEV